MACILSILLLWSVTPLPPAANDLLRGPFDSILSAVNASIADPRILLDSVVLPNDGGEAMAEKRWRRSDSEGHH